MMKQILQSLGFTLEKIVHANGVNISEDVKSYKISLESDIWRTGLKMAELKLNGSYTFDDFNQGVTLSMKATDEVSQQHDWGTFYLVDKSHLEYSDHMDETVLTLHDSMIKAHQELLQADLGITFPCTIDTLINAIGSYMGLAVSGSWANGSHVIEENKWENNGLTYRDTLDDIAFMANATIGVFNDILTFKPVNNTVVDTIDGGEISLTHEAKWGKPNVLNLTREPQHDNYAYPTDFTEIPKDERVELVIENNQIIDKRREELAPTLFSQIQNVEYTPFEYTGFGYLTMDYGDYVGFKDKDNNLQYGYVTKLEWQVGSGFTEMLGCELTTRAKEEYVLNTDQRRLGLQTYFLVDQQNGVIQGLVSKADELESKQSKLELDLNRINLDVGYSNLESVVSNGSGELGNYANWQFPETNERLKNYSVLTNRSYMNQFTNFVIGENKNSIAGFDLMFIHKGSAENGSYRVFSDYPYSFKIKRSKGNHDFTFSLQEYNENKTYIREQNYEFTENKSYESVENIELHNDTVWVGLKIITPNVSLENPLHLTEMTFGIGAPKNYKQTSNDLLQYAKGQFELQSNQAKLMIEEIKIVDGKTIENKNSIEMLGNETVLKVDQNGRLVKVGLKADVEEGSSFTVNADTINFSTNSEFTNLKNNVNNIELFQTFYAYSPNENGNPMYEDWATGRDYMGFVSAKTRPTNYAAYNWSRMTGIDGTDGRSVTDQVQEFYLSTSKTTQTDGSWGPTRPSWEVGKYLWTRLQFTFNKAPLTEYTGAMLDTSWEAIDSVGIKSTSKQFYLSTSSTTQTGGSWQDTLMDGDKNKYIWIRDKFVFEDNSIKYGTPYKDKVYTDMAILKDEAYLKIDSNGELGMFYLGRDESAGTIAKIAASQIKFEGLVTANEYFKIFNDGSIEALKGDIGGMLLENGQLSFPGGEVLLDVNGNSFNFGTMKIKHEVNNDGVSPKDVIVFETETGGFEFISGIQYPGGELPNTFLVDSLATNSIVAKEPWIPIVIGGNEGVVDAVVTGGLTVGGGATNLNGQLNANSSQKATIMALEGIDLITSKSPTRYVTLGSSGIVPNDNKVARLGNYDKNFKEVYSEDYYMYAMKVWGSDKKIWSQANLMPWDNRVYNLGGSSYRWDYIYLQNSPNVASDTRIKFAIQDIPQDLIARLSEIKPKMFLQQDKWHFGYIAQDVERALYLWATSKYGLEAKYYVDKFAVLHKDESMLSLLYGELAVLKEQQLQSEIANLKEEMAEIKAMLQEQKRR